MKRMVWSGVAALALVTGLAACSQREEAAEDLRTFDVEEQAAPEVQSEPSRAPGIVPTAAPGVAFNYRYGFRLPDANISAAQEEHAAACEKLGLSRCRITGMTYELDSRDRVNATLRLSIDPLLARGFGKDAIAVVEKHDGRLRFAEITGEDQNPALDDAARRQGSASQRIAQLEADLAKARSENERVQLREQIRQLRAEIEQARSQAVEAEAKIQRTPMAFNYQGGGASGRGFAGDNPATEAWYLFVDSLATLVSFALKGLAVILPWLVLVLLVVLAFRSRLGRKVRNWWAGNAEEAPHEG
ncbi:MAG TPA: DUF4349 domain-containing protein [Sphingomicrobium sp.]|nr:DUF4349 domain-containing protein [Sphingomicrobium sp.]